MWLCARTTYCTYAGSCIDAPGYASLPDTVFGRNPGNLGLMVYTLTPTYNMVYPTLGQCASQYNCIMFSSEGKYAVGTLGQIDTLQSSSYGGCTYVKLPSPPPSPLPPLPPLPPPLPPLPPPRPPSPRPPSPSPPRPGAPIATSEFSISALPQLVEQRHICLLLTRRLLSRQQAPLRDSGRTANGLACEPNDRARHGRAYHRGA